MLFYWFDRAPLELELITSVQIVMKGKGLFLLMYFDLETSQVPEENDTAFGVIYVVPIHTSDLPCGNQSSR